MERQPCCVKIDFFLSVPHITLVIPNLLSWDLENNACMATQSKCRMLLMAKVTHLRTRIDMGPTLLLQGLRGSISLQTSNPFTT